MFSTYLNIPKETRVRPLSNRIPEEEVVLQIYMDPTFRGGGVMPSIGEWPSTAPESSCALIDDIRRKKEYLLTTCQLQISSLQLMESERSGGNTPTDVGVLPHHHSQIFAIVLPDNEGGMVQTPARNGHGRRYVMNHTPWPRSGYQSINALSHYAVHQSSPDDWAEKTIATLTAIMDGNIKIEEELLKFPDAEVPAPPAAPAPPPPVPEDVAAGETLPVDGTQEMDNCPICMEPLDPADADAEMEVIKPYHGCSHEMHLGCYKNHEEHSRNPRCPLCRTNDG